MKKLPAPDYITEEINALKVLLTSVPARSRIGTDNHAAIAAQIAVLSGPLLERSEIALAFAGAPEDIIFQAYECWGWLTGRDNYDPPSRTWAAEVSPAEVAELTHQLNPATAHACCILAAVSFPQTGPDLWLLIALITLVITILQALICRIVWDLAHLHAWDDLEARHAAQHRRLANLSEPPRR